MRLRHRKPAPVALGPCVKPATDPETRQRITAALANTPAGSPLGSYYRTRLDSTRGTR